MGRKYIYSSVYELENVENLTELLKLLNDKKEYSEILRRPQNSSQYDKLSESEKSYIRKWDSIGSILEVGFQDYKTNDTLLTNYVKCVAMVEYHTKKIKNDDGEYFPKQDRLRIDYITCYFFESNSEVYGLILTSNNYNKERTKKLLEHSIRPNKVNPEPEAFSLSDDIFNWIFYLSQSKKGVIFPDMVIKNIYGFVGNVANEYNVIQGTSAQTLDLIVTKAFVSNGGILKTITFQLRDEKNAEIFCSIDTCSKAVINISDSAKLLLFDTVDNSEFFLLYLYCYLIKVLKDNYIKEANSFKDSKEKKFKKQIGIEVIDSIIRENHIDRSTL